MKLYDGKRTPNGRRVRIFIREKGIPLPEIVDTDIAKKEHLSPDYAKLNPKCRVPTLVLDDGTAIAESVAICRYFEALQGDPPLLGRDALEAALIEMWNRRVEFHLYIPVSTVFQHLHPAMKAMVDPQVSAWGEANRPRVFDFLRLLDGELRSRPYVAGNDFTIADITALVAVDFMKVSKLIVPEELADLRRWYASVSARPSASA